MSDLSSTLSTRNEFVHRHIGPREEDVQTMLKVLGFGTLEEMANHVVPKNIRNERNKTLRNLSYMKAQYFTQQHAGQTRKVLFEGEDKNGMIEGYTDNYIRITTPCRPEWVNEIVDWTI